MNHYDLEYKFRTCLTASADKASADVLARGVGEFKRVLALMQLDATEGECGAFALGVLWAQSPTSSTFPAALGTVARTFNVGAVKLPSVTFSDVREALEAKGVDIGSVDLSDVTSEREALERVAAHEAAQAGDGDTLTPAESIDLSGCSTSAEVREAYRRAGRDDLAAKVI